jgi:hypothetical protein
MAFWSAATSAQRRNNSDPDLFAATAFNTGTCLHFAFGASEGPNDGNSGGPARIKYHNYRLGTETSVASAGRLSPVFFITICAVFESVSMDFTIARLQASELTRDRCNDYADC